MTIDEFREELTEYFEENIINNDEKETVVVEIDHNIRRTNKGHGIVLKLKDVNFGPIFYNEELMKNLDRYSIPEIAEIMNVQATKFYDMNINHPKIDVIEPDDNIIFTAIPTSILPKNYAIDDNENYVESMLGLTVFMKTLIPDYPIPMAYGHVRKLDENDDKDYLYYKAKMNSLTKADIAVIVATNRKDVPPMISIIDRNQFTEFFYLLYDEILTNIAKTQGLRKIYVFSESPYSATLFGIPDTMSDEDADEFERTVMIPIIMDYKKTDSPLPTFIFYPNEKRFAIKTVIS